MSASIIPQVGRHDLGELQHAHAGERAGCGEVAIGRSLRSSSDETPVFFFARNAA